MNKIIPANHGFTATEENGRTVFTYEQERYTTGKMFLLIFPIALFSFLLLFPIQPSSVGTGFFFWLLFTIGIFSLVKYLLNRNRTTQRFFIDKQSFQVNGNQYLREHVTGLYIQAWRSPQSTSRPLS